MLGRVVRLRRDWRAKWTPPQDKNSAIGAGGLGTFIFRGVAMVSDAVILAGAIPAALLAIAADLLLGWLERRLKVV